MRVSLSDLVAAATSGKHVISFPTDTVPALAVRPDRSNLIFEVKQRSKTKPLILMGSCAADLWAYVQGSSAEQHLWNQVADRYWPGALTLVLPASDRLPDAINPTDATTIGVRVPDCAIACHVLAQTGPLATTSANRSGHPPLTTFNEIDEQFPDVLMLTDDELARLTTSLDHNQQSPQQPNSGVPSTVAKWMGDRWQILRQGQIHLAD
ncbi:MAG: L-threonylcarbamoyladenylate synthase [Elainellaceae cyanobacterium]